MAGADTIPLDASPAEATPEQEPSTETQADLPDQFKTRTYLDNAKTLFNDSKTKVIQLEDIDEETAKAIAQKGGYFVYKNEGSFLLTKEETNKLGDQKLTLISEGAKLESRGRIRNTARNIAKYFSGLETGEWIDKSGWRKMIYTVAGAEKKLLALPTYLPGINILRTLPQKYSQITKYGYYSGIVPSVANFVWQGETIVETTQSGIPIIKFNDLSDSALITSAGKIKNNNNELLDKRNDLMKQIGGVSTAFENLSWADRVNALYNGVRLGLSAYTLIAAGTALAGKMGISAAKLGTESLLHPKVIEAVKYIAPGITFAGNLTKIGYGLYNKTIDAKAAVWSFIDSSVAATLGGIVGEVTSENSPSAQNIVKGATSFGSILFLKFFRDFRARRLSDPKERADRELMNNQIFRESALLLSFMNFMYKGADSQLNIGGKSVEGIKYINKELPIFSQAAKAVSSVFDGAADWVKEVGQLYKERKAMQSIMNDTSEQSLPVASDTVGTDTLPEAPMPQPESLDLPANPLIVDTDTGQLLGYRINDHTIAEISLDNQELSFIVKNFRTGRIEVYSAYEFIDNYSTTHVEALRQAVESSQIHLPTVGLPSEEPVITDIVRSGVKTGDLLQIEYTGENSATLTITDISGAGTGTAQVIELNNLSPDVNQNIQIQGMRDGQPITETWSIFVRNNGTIDILDLDKESIISATSSNLEGYSSTLDNWVYTPFVENSQVNLDLTRTIPDSDLIPEHLRGKILQPIYPNGNTNQFTHIMLFDPENPSAPPVMHPIPEISSKENQIIEIADNIFITNFKGEPIVFVENDGNYELLWNNGPQSEQILETIPLPGEIPVNINGQEFRIWTQNGLAILSDGTNEYKGILGPDNTYIFGKANDLIVYDNNSKEAILIGVTPQVGEEEATAPSSSREQLLVDGQKGDGYPGGTLGGFIDQNVFETIKLAADIDSIEGSADAVAFSLVNLETDAEIVKGLSDNLAIILEEKTDIPPVVAPVIVSSGLAILGANAYAMGKTSLAILKFPPRMLYRTIFRRRILRKAIEKQEKEQKEFLEKQEKFFEDNWHRVIEPVLEDANKFMEEFKLETARFLAGNPSREEKIAFKKRIEAAQKHLSDKLAKLSNIKMDASKGVTLTLKDYIGIPRENLLSLALFQHEHVLNQYRDIIDREPTSQPAAPGGSSNPTTPPPPSKPNNGQQQNLDDARLKGRLRDLYDNGYLGEVHTQKRTNPSSTPVQGSSSPNTEEPYDANTTTQPLNLDGGEEMPGESPITGDEQNVPKMIVNAFQVGQIDMEEFATLWDMILKGKVEDKKVIAKFNEIKQGKTKPPSPSEGGTPKSSPVDASKPYNALKALTSNKGVIPTAQNVGEGVVEVTESVTPNEPTEEIPYIDFDKLAPTVKEMTAGVSPEGLLRVEENRKFENENELAQNKENAELFKTLIEDHYDYLEQNRINLDNLLALMAKNPVLAKNRLAALLAEAKEQAQRESALQVEPVEVRGEEEPVVEALEEFRQGVVEQINRYDQSGQPGRYRFPPKLILDQYIGEAASDPDKLLTIINEVENMKESDTKPLLLSELGGSFYKSINEILKSTENINPKFTVAMFDLISTNSPIVSRFDNDEKLSILEKLLDGLENNTAELTAEVFDNLLSSQVLKTRLVGNKNKKAIKGKIIAIRDKIEKQNRINAGQSEPMPKVKSAEVTEAEQPVRPATKGTIEWIKDKTGRFFKQTPPPRSKPSSLFAALTTPRTPVEHETRDLNPTSSGSSAGEVPDVLPQDESKPVNLMEEKPPVEASEGAQGTDSINQELSEPKKILLDPLFTNPVSEENLATLTKRLNNATHDDEKAVKSLLESDNQEDIIKFIKNIDRMYSSISKMEYVHPIIENILLEVLQYIANLETIPSQLHNLGSLFDLDLSLTISQNYHNPFYASKAFDEIIKIAIKTNKEEVITSMINNLDQYSWSGYRALLMNFNKLAEDQRINILKQLEESIEQGDFKFDAKILHVFALVDTVYYPPIVSNDLFIKLLNKIDQNINKENYIWFGIGLSFNRRSNPELQKLVNTINLKIKNFQEAAKNNN